MNFVSAARRVRRLYCLECGAGAQSPLPCEFFVDFHVKEHSIPDAREDDSFLLVERPKNETAILLDDSLGVMFTKDLNWSGSTTNDKRVVEKLRKKYSALAVGSMIVGNAVKVTP